MMKPIAVFHNFANVPKLYRNIETYLNKLLCYVKPDEKLLS